MPATRGLVEVSDSHINDWAASDSGLRESSWGSRKKTKRFEHHVVCRLSIYRCMWVHIQSTVLYGLREISWSSRKKPEPFRATPCPSHTTVSVDNNALSNSGLELSQSGL